MATRSRWRQHADEVVARTLAALPADVDLKTKRAALQKVYPFGERAMLPYKHWLKAVRAALGETKPKPPPKPTGVSYQLDRGAMLWLNVVCGMCEGKIPGGCLQCVRHNERLLAVVNSLEWRAFRQASLHDMDLAVLIASDWLKERGFEPLTVEEKP